MLQGILLKGYSGFYYVYAEDRVWECSLRGRFRIKNQEFIPGDRVKILPGAGKKATIEEVEARRNALVRPTIANIDQALMLFALTSPEPDLNFLDRLLIQVLEARVKPLLILNKIDLCQKDDQSDINANMLDFYAKLGYEVLKISTKTGEGISEVRAHLAGKVSVLAGPSGVGKSSLVNALEPGFKLKTGDVSLKSQRGRHTTRHVELLPCAGGLLADTPGFSSLYLPNMKREELAEYFPEFANLEGRCRFTSCMHHKEPDCAVKQAVDKGEIERSRYEHYVIFLEEVIETERRY